jgi:hypothetical protein
MMMLQNFKTKDGFRYMANSAAEAELLASGTLKSPARPVAPAARPSASNDTPSIDAADIYARRRRSVNAQRGNSTAPEDEPTEGESIFARRARQVRAQRTGTAPEGEGGSARIFSDEWAQSFYAARSRVRAGVGR